MKKKILRTLTALVAVFLLVYGGLVLYVYHTAKQDTATTSDAIIVLGEAALGGTSCFGPRCQQGSLPTPHYSVCLEARIDQAVSLYKNHDAAKIVMSGGTDPADNVNEAETMKTIAVQDGVPATDILLEDKSTSTYQNLAFSQKVLEEAGLHSAIIVTDPPTNARAGLVASKLQYTYSLSPDARTSCAHATDYLFREPLALMYYFLSGKI